MIENVCLSVLNNIDDSVQEWEGATKWPPFQVLN